MDGETTIFPALPVDHTAFNTIDTTQKAYLLGFLLADGTVNDPRPGICRSVVNLRIIAGDIQACRMVQQIAGGNLRTIEGGYRVIWEVNSDAIATSLISYGITPRKAFTASLQWDQFPAHLHGAALAGLIDGDGYLRFNRKGRRAEISVVTASTVLRDQLLEQFPFFKVVVDPPSKRRKSHLYKLVVENNRTLLKALIAQVYDPLPFSILVRKQRVLDKIRTYLDGQDAYELRMGEVTQLKAAGHTIADIAKQMGTSFRPVRERLLQSGYDGKVVLFTSDDRHEMRRLHDQGMTVLQVHAAIGKGTEQAVRYHLQRLGCLQKSPKPVQRHPQASDVLRLYKAGNAAYQIADQVHLCNRLVCKILRQEGISLRSGAAMKLSPDGVAWADAELQKGRNITSIARDLGVSTTLIRIRLKDKGQSLQP